MTATATVCLVWDNITEGVRCGVETVLNANNITIHNLQQSSAELTEATL